MATERTLRWLLRIFGTSSLLALIFVPAPYAWMNSIHSDLGMGPLPDEPIVGYLARSTSAFYALFGGLFWVVSFDLRRYRPVLLFLGLAVTLLGVTLLFVDLFEGMPTSWTLGEGPIVMPFGLAIFALARKLEKTSS